MPEAKSEITFNSLLNLVNVCHSNEKEVIWGFVNEYDKSLNSKDNPEIDLLIQFAINYYLFESNNKKVDKSSVLLSLCLDDSIPDGVALLPARLLQSISLKPKTFIYLASILGNSNA